MTIAVVFKLSPEPNVIHICNFRFTNVDEAWDFLLHELHDHATEVGLADQMEAAVFTSGIDAFMIRNHSHAD